MAHSRVLEINEWQRRLLHTIEQLPLIDRRATGPDSLRGPRPNTVFAGIGVCSPNGLSRALPIDVLGLLLPAEKIRRAAGARNLVVLVADYHAIQVGMPAERVRERTDEVIRTLRAVRSALGVDWTIGRASELAKLPAYRDGVYRLRQGRTKLPYSLLQAVDYEVIEDHLGPVLKIGWSIGDNGDPFSRRDEVGFDRRTAMLLGRKLRTIYCRPGRALDDRAPRAIPYVALDPDARICLDAREDVRAKLQQARCRADTRKGYQRLLKQITRELAPYDIVDRGDIGTRTQRAIERLSATSGQVGGADELTTLVRGGDAETVELSQSV